MKDCHRISFSSINSNPFRYHSPESYIDTNVKGTLNIVQAAKDYDIERVLITSTSEVYGTAQYVPIDESHPLNLSRHILHPK